MDRFKLLSAVLFGALVGSTCAGDKGSGLIDSAHAAGSSDCAQWEAQAITFSATITPGWEPFAMYCSSEDSYDCLGIRRCVE
jgi:hypothetical protein